jgi:hypothetical protein
MPATTALVLTDAASPEATRRGSSATSARLTWLEIVDERAPLIGAPAFFGPPIIFVLGPWLLVVLLLIGPFALILTLLLVLAGAAGLLAMCVAVIASPYLLVRRLQSHGVSLTRPRLALHPFSTHRVGSGRLRSPQPKEVS